MKLSLSTSPRYTQIGLVYGILAPLLFGLYTLVWRGLSFVSPTELVAYRCIFSLLALVAVIVFSQRWKQVRSYLSLGVIREVAKPAAFLLIHWGGFLGAITSGHQLQASVGMFLAPSATAVLASFLLKEKLNASRCFALSLSMMAVVLLLNQATELPLFAFMIATSWAGYNCYRKKAFDFVENSLVLSCIEQLLLGGVALVYLTSTAAFNPYTFSQVQGFRLLALALGCAGTVVPSLLHAEAAKRLDGSVLGMLGALSPGVQFLIGIYVYKEVVAVSQWLTVGLLLFAVLLYNRRQS